MLIDKASIRNHSFDSHITLTDYYCCYYYYYLHQGGYVFISICLFAHEHNYAKTTTLIFSQFDGKVGQRPWKKLLDFGGNSGHVRVRARLQLWLG